jgi:D12 class N6 adenine-specific DNA methyltransferase
MLKPFFTYYGGKYRIAPKYPSPQYDLVIEPFAGSAGYSLRHAAKQVRLYDTNPKVIGLWQYLIRVSEAEILALPVVFESTDDLKVCEEAKWLIGFWCNKGTVFPCKRPSAWMREGLRPNSFWGPVIRERVASQLCHIRHWTAAQMSYDELPDFRGTWFIDPPYSGKDGMHYTKNSIDFSALGEWCKQRFGQVMVCEQEGAAWLPFAPFCTAKAREGGSKTDKVCKEVLWTNK